MSAPKQSGERPIPCPPEVLTLVEHFERNRDDYKSGQYNEAQLRQQFLNPLFEALGWDMANRAGYAEAYKEVIHEDAIKIGKETKAPDYCFRIGGTRKFFLEAKKPSVYIKEEVPPAFQLRRYAWSAKLPLSVLCDFEEFAVYDTRIKPDRNDKASTARILYLTYKEYADKWGEIVSVFSKDAVLRGSFDKYAETTRLKKGTATVDDAFLTEIEDWRDLLARNIALRNADLTTRELNFAVQRTVDRIVFLRICEDRGIEEYGRLQALQNGTNAYKRLVQIFSQADDRYNSGLFHFQKEKDRHEEPDTLTTKIEIDDKPLKDIIKRLYYPESPYEFSVLSADILGQVYEQFLGKVIRLTAGHQAKVEEKPEVRKAGGVYYTPKYIVDYIVKNTVGVLVGAALRGRPDPGAFQGEGQPHRVAPTKITPKEASKLRILDPACGSGSFLLGAYQYLLDWHQEWYVKDDPKKWATSKNPTLYQAQGGDYRLTTAERKRILLNNIYGVDIDSQAVEVTKLSLLLKVLEGETSQTLQSTFIHERALPDLGDNIKCGNSLIGPDFYQQQTMLDDEERLRVNVFDWEKEFAEIMKAGGFDAVIGNPPYGVLFSESEKKYIQECFKSYKYKYDSYIYFIEKALNLARRGGFVSYITPELWLKLENCEPLRRYISDNASFRTLRIYGESVFSSAVVSTIVFALQRGVQVDKLEIETNDDSWLLSSDIWKKAGAYAIDYRLKPESSKLVEKIRTVGKMLESFGEAIQGITPYDKYRGQAQDLIKRRGYHFRKKQDKTCGKWLAGKDVSRYDLKWSGEWLSYGPWLAAPREPRFFEGVRLLFREVPGSEKRIQATIVEEETYYHGHSITPFKTHSSSKVDLRYLLGHVNSKLISWYGGLILPNFGKDIFPKLNPQDIKELPIYPVSFSSKSDKARHDKMVSLVDQMLLLNKQLPTTKTDHEKTALQRQIDATDRQIDQLVYELYGLTEEEIRIVEGN